VFSGQGVTLSNVKARSVDATYVSGTGIVTATVVTNGDTFARSLVIPVLRDGASTPGARGAGHYYVTGSTWSDIAAQAACPGGPVVNDVVTISSGSFVGEKRWTGSAWIDNGVVINGKLIVPDSILASAIDTRGLTVKDSTGKVLLGVGVPLDAALAAPGTKNSEADFQPYQSWDFNNTLDGWAVSGGTPTLNATTLTATANTTDLYIRSGVVSVPAINTVVRARVRRVSGTGFDGGVYFQTNAQVSESTNGRVALKSGAIVTGEWTIFEFDASANANWTGTITRIRLELGSNSTDVYEVDWVTVGRMAPGASAMAVADAATTASWANVASKPADSEIMNSALDPKFAGLDTAKVRWDFTGSVEGWSSTGTLALDTTTDPNAVIWTPNAANPVLSVTIPTADRFVGGDYRKVRARIKRLSGTGPWEGNLYYGTASHGHVSTYYATTAIPPNPDQWNIIEWDMEKLEQGGTDWLTNTITTLRMDLVSSNSPASSWAIDWIAVGKFNTGASPALLDKKLDNADTVLKGVLSLDATTVAGLRVGTLTWNAAGVRQSGYGTAMTPAGLVGYRQSNGSLGFKLGTDGEFTLLDKDGGTILTTESTLAQQAASNPNLVPGPRGWSTFYSGAYSWRNGNVVFGNGEYIGLAPASSAGGYIAAESPPCGAPAGATITVSFDASCDSGTRTLSLNFFGPSVDTTAYSTVLTTTFKRYVWTITLPNVADAPKAFLRMWSSAVGAQIIISNIKVEMGSKATPWCDNAITADNAKNRVFIPNLAALTAYVGNMEIGPGGALWQGMSEYSVGTGMWFGQHGGVNKFFVGNLATSAVWWDGSKFNIQSAKIITTFSATIGVLSSRVGNSSTYTTYTIYPTFSGGSGTIKKQWSFSVESGDIKMISAADADYFQFQSRGSDIAAAGYVNLIAVDDTGATTYATRRVSVTYGNA
ncbi:hypothetical protein, partial [Agrobacterium tumefaciens]|uniref:hypothetical protein n=1 Tax=Agrobacterium tumefaciens TaxID=358 RepID=UPI001BAD9956